MKDIKNLNTKTILITGGTGSFGKAFLNLALNHTDVEEIRIFSRDEKKQDDMRNTFKDERLRFYIGDVRDIQSLKDALHGTDYVFHAAALKQVPACEFFPLEAVRTNVLGTENVLQASIDLNIENKINNFNRQALHAKSLGFYHPKNSKEIFFEAKRPRDFEELIKNLKNATN